MYIILSYMTVEYNEYTLPHARLSSHLRRVLLEKLSFSVSLYPHSPFIQLKLACAEQGCTYHL